MVYLSDEEWQGRVESRVDVGGLDNDLLQKSNVTLLTEDAVLERLQLLGRLAGRVI